MKKNIFLHSVSLMTLVSCLSGCGILSHRGDSTQDQADESDSHKIERLQAQNSQLATALTNMTAKLTTLESKITSMSDKLDATRGRVDNLMANQIPKTSPLKTMPTEGAVTLPPPGDQEAEASFVADEAVQRYRQAMLLFESRNYPDSVLAFAAFVERFPDHPLAGSAQYFLGESYFKENEYKLAARELQRVITTYDRSPRIAETLRDLAFSEDKTGLPEDAARHRQLLSSLFPHSPAAAQAPVAQAPAAETGTRADPRTPESPRDDSKIDAVPSTVQQSSKAEGQSLPNRAGSGLDPSPPTAPLSPSEAGTQNP